MTRRRMRRLGAAALLLAAALLAAIGGWRAAHPTTATSLHARAVAIERQLRCPTCQGLSVADSPSPIAAGMRRDIETQLAAGATPAQIRGYFVARYSDWILLDPPRRGIGWLLWAAPALLLGAGLGLMWRALRRRRPSAPAVTAAEVADATRWATAPSADDPDLPDPVAAAIADVRAAQVDADLDPDGHLGLHAAATRLATVLREHPASRDGGDDDEPNIHGDPAATKAPPDARQGVRRVALPVTAVLFAGLLGATLARTVGTRPAGAVPTGTFATIPATATPAPDLAALGRATRDRPTDPAAWLAYATALDQAGQLAAAEPGYRRTLALDPTNVITRERLGWLLTRGGSPDEALTILAPTLRARPNDPQVVLLVGLAQRGAGLPQATATLRHYLQLEPTGGQADLVRALLAGHQ